VYQSLQKAILARKDEDANTSKKFFQKRISRTQSVRGRGVNKIFVYCSRKQFLCVAGRKRTAEVQALDLPSKGLPKPNMSLPQPK
jgi:hypothetical protein